VKVFLVNDTSMWNNHFGCRLIGQTYRELFSRFDLDLIGACSKHLEEKHLKIMEKADLIIVNGEGSIRFGRNQHLVDLAGKFPCVLLNAVWQDNPDNPNLKHFKYISVRESLSSRELTDQGFKNEIVPDIIFTSLFLNSYIKGSPTRDMGFTDCVIKTKRRFYNFKKTEEIKVDTPLVADYLNQLSSFGRICTGRFHAVVACSVLGIPFSAWPSNSHKIEGLLKDMDVEYLLGRDRSEAAAKCPVYCDEKIGKFVDSAKQRIFQCFSGLHTYV
jgi:Polysaccharide pyruvyl transferase